MFKFALHIYYDLYKFSWFYFTNLNSSFVFLEQNKPIVRILVKPEINKTYSNKSVAKVDTRIIMIVVVR